MVLVPYSKVLKIVVLLLTICLLSLPTYAKYSGGTGDCNDPYQIATSEDLILLGETPEDYDKHFILTDDIDLDPNLGGHKVFDGAIIDYFKGVFDGNGHTISNFSCTSLNGHYIGFFKQISGENAQIKNLGLIAPDIEAGAGRHVGSLVGLFSSGTITNCYTEGGSVTGEDYVGGQVGYNHGNIYDCYTTCSVTGKEDVGGLIGENGYGGIIRNCYSTGKTTGSTNVGGIVGRNYGSIKASYSYADVEGQIAAGGLVGRCVEPGEIINCYAQGNIVSEWYVGGLLGSNGLDSRSRTGGGTIRNCYSASASFKGSQKGGLLGANWSGDVTKCFWDVEISGLARSYGGLGKTTAEMQTAATFLEAGWELMDEAANSINYIWKISEGFDYPRLWWEKYGGGNGKPNNPYLIYTAEHLNEMSIEPNDWDKHFELKADIDLSGYSYDRALIAQDNNDTENEFQGIPFTGVFDGNGFTISNLTINGESYLGLFGQLDSEAKISNLGIIDVNIMGLGDCVGGLVGRCDGQQGRSTNVNNCHSTGTVIGNNCIGGLIGWSHHHTTITKSRSTATVSGGSSVGGLVGFLRYGSMVNCYGTSVVSGDFNVGGLVGNMDYTGYVTNSYFAGTISGGSNVGGLVGLNYGNVTECYNMASISGDDAVGGIAGFNTYNIYERNYNTVILAGTISYSYSVGTINGSSNIGGLVGYNDGIPGEWNCTVKDCFWDIDISDVTSISGNLYDDATGLEGSFGKTTGDMQTATTFLDAGWDFVDETANGDKDIWWILEGQDYPRLWWELIVRN